MSVTVDHELMAVEKMGLLTVGEVLSRLQRDNRLVVNLLIDGQEPNLTELGRVRAAPLTGHTLFIETVEPRAIALQVLHEVDVQLREADRLKDEAVDFLQRNAPAPAMERLSGCFTTWNNAQESIRKTAQLLRLDLERIRIESGSLNELLTGFAVQLREIKGALEDRDFVTLSDILAYEMTQTSEHWRQALSAVRTVIGD